MKGDQQLSKRWKYSFLIIGIAAGLCCLANLYYKQYIIAGATAIVVVAQIQNYRKWKKKQN